MRWSQDRPVSTSDDIQRERVRHALELIRRAEHLLTDVTLNPTSPPTVEVSREARPVTDVLAGDRTLHDRLVELYGEDWSSAVADRLYTLMLGPDTDDNDPLLAGDPLVAPYFLHRNGTRVNRRMLARHQAWFLRVVAGDGEWTHRSIREVHADVVHWQTGEGVTDEVYDRVVGHVVVVLRELRVPEPLFVALTGAVEDLRSEVVAPPPPSKES